MTSPTPRYKHDCPQCKFLGHFNQFDLYFCEQLCGPTVIARKSDDPPDYTSGISFGIKNNRSELHEALVRALAAGYITIPKLFQIYQRL